jgi:CheY-like chemotaxis protein
MPIAIERQNETSRTVEDWTSSGTLLIVDDEPMVRFVMTTVLSATGFTVLEAEDGKKALEIFSRHRGDIRAVLLDLSMPVMDGEETYAELRRLSPAVPVVLLSGYNEKDSLNRFPAEALAGFLGKPFKPVALVEKVRQVLEGSSH